MVVTLMSGQAVRIQPNHVSFSSLQAMEDIYGPRSVMRKLDPYKVFFPPKESRSLFCELFSSLKTTPRQNY